MMRQWNSTKLPYPQTSIQTLVEEQARQFPNATAVVSYRRRLTYQDLNRRANQLAWYLKKRGVGSEGLVALGVERSEQMVVAVLGILKAGGAYVPLDPEHPPDRLTRVLSDAKPLFLLTQQALRQRLPQQLPEVLLLDEEAKAIAAESEENLREDVGPKNLAYVIYTSGSTGKPKGVQIEHGSVVNLLCSLKRELAVSHRDVLVGVTTLSFDIAGLEILLPLISGARLVVARSEEARDGVLLQNLLRESRATIMQATPATWRMLLDAGWDGLSRMKILCGGEALTLDLGSQLLRRDSSVWNLYGPTETTIWSTIYRVHERKDGTYPIGRPIANTQIYVLDEERRPVPVGAPGELYIGGDGLARGYLNRTDLTSKSFLENPFSGEPGARLYKTGDLARYLEDGNIEYLGRLDHQVKIRGFRIELGEVEAALTEHPAVKVVVAIVREDHPNDKRIVAYIIPRENPVTSEEIRQFSKLKLPDYMVPSHVVFLKSFPLTPNGKVDRRALPPPDVSTDEQETMVAPRNSVESRLVDLWEKLLNVNPISVNSNFFDLGGHSLLLAKLLVEIERTFARRLSIATFFRAATIAQLAELLTNGNSHHQISSFVPYQPLGSSPPVFCLRAPPMFRTLARHLGPDQPFFGLMEDPSEVSTAGVRQKFEHLVEDFYVKKIREHQAEGPYFLAGWCFNAVVAYEVARQLIAQNQKIGLLAIFDSPNPASYLKLSKTAQAYSMMQLTRFHLWNLRKLRGQERLFYLLERLKGVVERLTDDPNGSKSLPNLEPILFSAARSYSPQPSPIPTVHFLPAERPKGAYWDLQYDWTRFVTGPIEVHEVPGDHRSMFLEPNVEILASRIKECLKLSLVFLVPQLANDLCIGMAAF